MVPDAEEVQLVWERVRSTRANGGIFKLDWEVYRTKVPGGWLVVVMHNTSGLRFYPDPEHKWDAASST